MPVKRKTSPKRVRRKTSPKRIKRKTSPKRVRRKTSPKRKRRMNGIGDYFGRRAGREVRTDDPGAVDIDWTEEMEDGPGRPSRQDSAGPGRPSRQDSAGPGRPRAREYDMISDERLGDTKLVEILTYVDTCEELMKMQQTSRRVRTVIMENLPYIYMKLREKDKSLPVLVWSDSPEHNYTMFVNSCLDRERQKVIGDSIEGIDSIFSNSDIAMRGYRDYERFKELKRRLTHPSLPDHGADYIAAKILDGDFPFFDCMIDTVKGLLDLGFRYSYMIRIVKNMGCLTNEAIMFLRILIERLNPTGSEKYKILRFMYERNPQTIIYDYENGRIGNREALQLLEDYMREGL